MSERLTFAELEAAMEAHVASIPAKPFQQSVADSAARMRRADPTALSNWLPKLQAAGLPVPHTILLDMPDAAQASIWRSFDGDEPLDNSLAEFAVAVAEACAKVGLPAFLRTDHTSGKHEWSDCCFVASSDTVARNVSCLATFSELNSLPWARWAVREFLPTTPLGVCPHFGSMPVCREFRFFVDNGKVRCFHPYWPQHALEQGGCADIDFEALCHVDDEAALGALAEAAGRAVPGSWSIDLLETKRGWFITDMAEAHKSYHWESCAALADRGGERK